MTDITAKITAARVLINIPAIIMTRTKLGSTEFEALPVNRERTAINAQMNKVVNTAVLLRLPLLRVIKPPTMPTCKINKMVNGSPGEGVVMSTAIEKNKDITNTDMSSVLRTRAFRVFSRSPPKTGGRSKATKRSIRTFVENS